MENSYDEYRMTTSAAAW